MNNGLEIAIIGLAGKFPGAKDAEEYWHNLEQGIESIHFYDESELNPETTRQGLQKKSNFVNAGGKLANIDLFDAEFFNFSPKEAEILDPQHRLFLETAWTALENAGYDSEQYQGSIGVFGGAGMNGYQFNLFRNPDVTQTTSNYELFLGSEKDFLTTRVSYKLNLEGPSVNLQTACSTSLVAVHVAAQSLLSGECDMALAGGVAISLSTGYLAQEGSIYSPDGHCRAFAENAQGTVGGSGVGIVVLKRLEDAIAEQDHVLAIVKGSAIDNDGALKVSYTAPRIDTQARVIQTAQLVGEVEPETISYIEAHGTGTSLGDPIEIAALTQAFRTSTDKKQFCAISSVKTNIGHLDAAAGVASLIKAVLALQNKSIPPSLNCDRPNSKIDWENSPFFVNRELKTWESNGLVRRAGVSSFGIGGTNAHVVLEEAPRLGAEGHEEHGGAAVEARVGERRKGMSTKREGQDPSTLLVISAKTETALETATVNLSEHLSHNPDLDLKDVAYTLQVGRRAFDYRLTLVCKSVTDAINQLENRQEVFSNKIEAGSKPVVFMFSGQGSQYLGMAQELYQNEPIFKESCDRCFQLLQPYLDLDLNEIIFPFTPHLPISPAPSPLINQTQYAQPAIFAIEYALAQLLSHWGIKPEATIGHSIGEYVAATLAEVFSLEDALKLVADRARLMQQQPTGVMLSVALAASDVTAVIEKSSSPAELSLAVVNTPELCVISGTEKAIAELENTFMDQGVACRRLKTSHGFHSYLMDGAVSPFVEIVKQVKLHPPRIPFISNITGTWITDAQATDPEYWGQQIRSTVQFAKGVETITSESERILLEVGAGRALTTLAKQIHPQSTILQSLPHIKQKQNQSDRAFLLRTCSQLWLAGVDFNWSNFYPQKPSRIPLPTYPFERKRYWVEATTELTSNAVIATTENRDISEWFYLPSWSRDLPIPKQNDLDLVKKDCNWLIFADELETCAKITTQLNSDQHQPLIVTKGKEFTINNDGSFTINPQVADHYKQLINYLKDQNLTFQKVLYLWTFSENLSEQKKTTEQEKTQTTLFSQLLYLFQAFGNLPLTEQITVEIISSNLFNLDGQNLRIGDRAILSGFTKVTNQEYPNLKVHLKDLESPQQLSSCLPAIINDSNSTNEQIIAYRQNYRWLPQYQSYPIKPSERSRLKTKGVYIIIGDLLRGLGLVWAKYLVEKWQAQLILIDSNISELDLDFIEAEKLVTFNIDINNEVELKNALSEIATDFPKVEGVFFSTPMTNRNSASLIQELNLSHWQYNTETKIRPIQLLDCHLPTIKPNFVCVQSSLSSVLGGLGLAAYGSANSYLDNFIDQKNNDPNNLISWFSINWDAHKPESTQQSSNKIGESLQKFSLTSEEIGEATNRILSLPIAAQIVVSKADLQTRIAKWVTSTDEKDNSPSDQNKEKLNNIVKHSRPQLTQEYVAPRNETEQQVAIVWQQVLGVDKIGIYDSFFELGGHSLLAIQSISRLREKFQVELPISSILSDEPTIANLAKTITDQLPEQSQTATIEALLDEVTQLSPEEVEALLNSHDLN